MTTPPTSSGMRREMLSVLSIALAVAPPTCTRTPGPTAPGTTWSRRSRTRALVALDCGPLSGTTVSSSERPSEPGTGGVTAATPGTAFSAVGSAAVASAGVPGANSATRTSGPLLPGPKPAATVSYASRFERPAGSLPASGKPKRTPRNGAASASRTTTPVTAPRTR